MHAVLCIFINAIQSRPKLETKVSYILCVLRADPLGKQVKNLWPAAAGVWVFLRKFVGINPKRIRSGCKNCIKVQWQQQRQTQKCNYRNDNKAYERIRLRWTLDNGRSPSSWTLLFQLKMLLRPHGYVCVCMYACVWVK